VQAAYSSSPGRLTKKTSRRYCSPRQGNRALSKAPKLSPSTRWP